MGGVRAWLREYYKEKLCIKEDKVILAVGQFIYRKGFDILIRTAEYLSNEIGIYIIGGEPTQEYLELIQSNNIRNVHFVSFKTRDELQEYYYAADVFVHPTREDIWGLVVNEAMAKWLPVITTDKCVAGLELITDSSLGRIVPAENVDALEAAIKNMLEQEKMDMLSLIVDKIKGYTYKAMAEKHIEVWIN